MKAGAKSATSVGKEVAGDLGEKEVLAASKNAGQTPESYITGGRENTVTGGSDLSLKGSDKDVTDGAGETTDIKAGAKTASAVDNEVNNGVEEKEGRVASEKPQQESESEIATTVDKDTANEKKDLDTSDPSQTGKLAQARIQQKTYNQRSFKLNSFQKMLVQKRIKIWKTVT
jgi:hypothetical protein